MIGNMAVRITADRPNFPLGTLFVRAGSAANIALVGVPVRPGVNVTALALRVENVDGATADYAARAIGGVWVVDVPAAHFATVGSVTGGVSVWATGTGADGETSRTWCVGVGDLEVLTADADAPAPAPGQTFWPLRMFDAAPASPTKYNAYIDGAALKIWNGTAWVEISGGSIDVADAVTRASANPVKSSGIWSAIWGALTALPAGITSLYDWCVAQLRAKRDYGDLSYERKDSSEGGWILHIGGNDVRLLPAGELTWTDTGSETDGTYTLKWLGFWHLVYVSGSGLATCVDQESPEDATELALVSTSDYETVVATATAAPVDDALALRSEVAEKQDELTPAQLAAANSGATAAKVGTWDGYAAQIAAKASAADLRYRIAEAGYATTGARLPDNVAYVIADGTTYQASALTLDGTSTYMLFGNGNVLGVEWRRDTGTLIGNPFNVVFYDSSDTPFSAVPDLLVPRALADRTVNRVTPADASALTLTLPAVVEDHARDLIVRLDLTALATAPEVTFAAPTGETVKFETEDGAMPELEAGKVNLVSLTETAAGVIDVAHKTMQEVE